MAPSVRRRRRLRRTWRSQRPFGLAGVLLLATIYLAANWWKCDTAYPAADDVVVREASARPGERKFTAVVLTHSRHASLLRLLKSLSEAEYGEDRIDLHIWIDRSAPTSIRERVWGVPANESVLEIATRFEWVVGEKVVHVWRRHVGIWGQWIDSWRPEGDEGGVILEDDLELSPIWYKWLKEARKAYNEREDVFGYTLQKGELRANQTGFGRRKLKVGEDQKAFLYLLLGSWGYSPKAGRWRDFRQWFHRESCAGTKPYVEGLIPTKWYRKQEKRRSMWTMWHIKYADERQLYTVYGNYNGTLAGNWREEGLHFKRGGRGESGVVGERDFSLLASGTRLTFPARPVRLFWNGTYTNERGRLCGL